MLDTICTGKGDRQIQPTSLEKALVRQDLTSTIEDYCIGLIGLKRSGMQPTGTPYMIHRMQGNAYFTFVVPTGSVSHNVRT